jgi:hypothetical protein
MAEAVEESPSNIIDIARDLKYLRLILQEFESRSYHQDHKVEYVTEVLGECKPRLNKLHDFIENLEVNSSNHPLLATFAIKRVDDRCCWPELSLRVSLGNGPTSAKASPSYLCTGASAADPIGSGRADELDDRRQESHTHLAQ